MRQVPVTLLSTHKEREDWECVTDLTGRRVQGWNAKPGVPASEPVGVTIQLHCLSWSRAEICGSPKYVEILTQIRLTSYRWQLHINIQHFNVLLENNFVVVRICSCIHFVFGSSKINENNKHKNSKCLQIHPRTKLFKLLRFSLSISSDYFSCLCYHLEIIKVSVANKRFH